MNPDYILQEMKKLAQDNNVDLTDNAVNIARFRARTGLPLPPNRGQLPLAGGPQGSMRLHHSSSTDKTHVGWQNPCGRRGGGMFQASSVIKDLSR